MATNLDRGIYSFWIKVSHWHVWLVHESLNKSREPTGPIIGLIVVSVPPIAMRSKPTLTISRLISGLGKGGPSQEKIGFRLLK